MCCKLGNLVRILPIPLFLMVLPLATGISSADDDVLIILTELDGLNQETYQVTDVLEQWFQVLFSDYENVTIERSDLCVGFNETNYAQESVVAQAEGILNGADMVYWGAYMVEGTRIRIALVTQYTHISFTYAVDGSQPRIFTREEAFDLSEVAFTDNPPDLFAVNAYQNLSAVFGNKGDYLTSLTLLNKSIERSGVASDIEVAFLYGDRALLYLRAFGKPDLALDDIDIAIELAPDVIEFQEIRDETLVSIESGGDVEYQLAVATEFEEGSLWYYYAIAVNLDLAERYQEALGFYDEAIAAGGTPEDIASVYIDRSMCNTCMGNYDAAFADAQTALELNPINSTAYARLSEIAEDQGDFMGCIEHLSTGITLEPDAYYLIGNRARVYYHIGELDLAKEDFLRAIELNPGDHDLYFEIGSIHAEQNMYSEAAEYFTEALDYSQLRGEKAYYLALRGGCYMELGDYDSARSDFDEALTFDSGCTKALFFRGVMHYNLNDYPNALLDMQRVLELSNIPAERATAQSVLDEIGY